MKNKLSQMASLPKTNARPKPKAKETAKGVVKATSAKTPTRKNQQAKVYKASASAKAKNL